jgi:hypothetical protein
MRGVRLVFVGYALYATAHRALEFGALAREGVDADRQVVVLSTTTTKPRSPSPCRPSVAGEGVGRGQERRRR